MELKDALKETIKRNGKEVLSDTNLLKSYLMDLAPDKGHSDPYRCKQTSFF